MSLSAQRRPGETIEVLQTQLERELNRLDEGASEEPELYRAYLHGMLALTWRQLANGDMAAPRRALRALEPTRTFKARHLPRSDEPKARAARELQFAWSTLESADRAAEAAGFKEELRRPTSRVEQALLRQLMQRQGHFVRRAELHQALVAAGIQVSPPRISQILKQLHRHKLLLRTERKAQGSSETGFYMLSKLGVEFCQKHLSEEVVVGVEPLMPGRMFSIRDVEGVEAPSFDPVQIKVTNKQPRFRDYLYRDSHRPILRLALQKTDKVRYVAVEHFDVEPSLSDVLGRAIERVRSTHSPGRGEEAGLLSSGPRGSSLRIRTLARAVWAEAVRRGGATELGKVMKELWQEARGFEQGASRKFEHMDVSTPHDEGKASSSELPEGWPGAGKPK